ncbi:MAG: 2-amino-4-hydroxy-6-hydroxymethyldihydropteridine diphosphokinase [Elusimicrobiota bacterium]
MENLVVLSIGSNTGDRAACIIEAVSILEKKFGKKFKKSPVYETPPLYYEDQDDFYNCCVGFRTDINPPEIHEITSSVEDRLGRKRDEKNGPRVIDIDIVFVGDIIMADNRLTVPHPALQDRLFVLQPAADIYPEFVHPAMQLTVSELLEECPDRSKIKKIDGFWKDR